MAVRILHLADLHIGYEPRYLDGEKAVQRAEEFKDAFRRAVDYAVDTENAIKAVIIAGDLFDSYRPDETVKGFARAQLGRLSSASIPVLIIPGTHDSIALPGSVYRTESFPSGVHLLTGASLESPLELVLGGERFSFYWLIYEPRLKMSIAEFLGAVKPRLPEKSHRIFVAHASVIGSPEWNMRRKDLPVSREDLLSSGMDYVALGHYHNFSEFESKHTKVVYPGTLEGKSFGEDGPRHLVVVEFENGRTRIEKRVFNQRTMQEKELSLDSEPVSCEEELIERIASMGSQELLLKLTLTGHPDFMVREDFLGEAVSDRFFYIEVEDETSALSAISTEAIAGEKTIRGMFVRRIKEAMVSAADNKRPVYELALKEGLSAFAAKGVVVPPRSE